MIDGGALLANDRFMGNYGGKGSNQHRPDIDVVINRARSFGVQGFIFTGSYFEDCEKSLDLCYKTANSYATIGLSPQRAIEPYKTGI